MILAIETSGRDCSLALSADGVIVSELPFHHQMRLVELLQSHIQEALESAGTKLSQLTVIAVSTGPGSYTGLRVGVTAAKTMGYALGIPVVPVSTLQAIAEQALPTTTVAAIMRARPGHIYWQVFEGTSGQARPMKPATLTSLPEAVEALSGLGHSITLCGDILERDGALICSMLEETGISVVRSDSHIPRASTIALIAGRLLAAGGEYSAFDAEPIYLAEPAIGPAKSRPTTTSSA